MSSLGEVFVTKAYAKKPAKQGGGRVKVVKADYGDSGTNRAYSITGRKAGKRVVAAKREKDTMANMPKPKPKKKANDMLTGEAWRRQQERIKRDMAKRAAKAPVPKSERKPMPAATPVKPDRRVAGRVARKGR